MKFVLLVMLFVCFVLIAVAVYFFYYIRYLIFKDLYYISGYIKNNIVFNKNSISDILSTCKDNVSLYTRLYISKKNIKYFKMMNNNDKKNIDMFFDSLGKGNVDYEINNLNYYENVFNNLMINSKENVNSKGIVYLKLVILFGVIVVILLI